jgi:hypothetical protein
VLARSATVIGHQNVLARGDVKGLIAALDRVVGEFPSDTKVIPGHGQLATMHDLEQYVTMEAPGIDAGEFRFKISDLRLERESTSAGRSVPI